MKALDKAARYLRDTLREDDEHDGNSTICSDSRSDAPDNADDDDHASAIRFDDDGCPDGASVPKPWEIRESVSKPGRYFYYNPVTGKSTWTHPGTRKASKRTCRKKHSSGTPGRVPALDLFRIWDSGAPKA